MEQPKGKHQESSREVRSEPGKHKCPEPPREPETPDPAEEHQAKQCTRKRQKQVIRKPQGPSYEQESGEEPEAELSNHRRQQLPAPEQGARPRRKHQELLHEPDSEAEANTQKETGEEAAAEQVSPRAHSKL
jgi:hypothetical protein